MLYFETLANARDVLNYKKDEDPEHAGNLSVSESASLMQVISFMADHTIGITFVENENEEISGLISARAIFRHIAMNGKAAFDMPIAPLVVRDILSCDINTKLKAVAAQMAEEGVRHIAVRDETEQICGIISSSDILLFAGEG